MRKRCIGIIVIISIFSAVLFPGNLPAMENGEIVPAESAVRVQYQWRGRGATAWSTSTSTLRGAVTESMMVNQLTAKHSGGEIRILSAAFGKTVTRTVRYQMKRGSAPWTTGTTTLNDALTASMAANQLRARYPGATIRILSFVRKR